MRCQACDKALSDAEASFKYLNWREIVEQTKNPEDAYPLLCAYPCLKESGLLVEGNPLASEDNFQDDPEQEEPEDDPDYVNT